jgi:hypothetical protein
MCGDGEWKPSRTAKPGSLAGLLAMMTSRLMSPRRRVPQPLDAAFTLPGALADAADRCGCGQRRVGARRPVPTCLLVAAIALISEPFTALLAAIGWFTVAGFQPAVRRTSLFRHGASGIIVTAVAGSAG